MSVVIVRHSPIHGTGVFAARDIRREEEILAYEGKLLTHAEADADGVEDDGHTFLFTLNDHFVIEAGIGGNAARWINHSCEPNCEAVLVESEDGDPRNDAIVIQALRRIRKGEELTYDYNIEADGPLTRSERRLWRCRCGAKSCTGVILRAPGRP